MTSTLAKQIAKITDIAELDLVLADVTAHRNTVVDTARAAIVTQMEALAQSLGMSATQVLRGKTEKSSVAVKFRHKDDSALTWTGRGRKPVWFAAAEAAGLIDQVAE